MENFFLPRAPVVNEAGKQLELRLIVGIFCDAAPDVLGRGGEWKPAVEANNSHEGASEE